MRRETVFRQLNIVHYNRSTDLLSTDFFEQREVRVGRVHDLQHKQTSAYLCEI